MTAAPRATTNDFARCSARSIGLQGCCSDAFPAPAGDILDAGGGTGLFSEWLADPQEPLPGLRAALRARRLVILDASVGMLRYRTAHCF